MLPLTRRARQHFRYPSLILSLSLQYAVYMYVLCTPILAVLHALMCACVYLPGHYRQCTLQRVFPALKTFLAQRRHQKAQLAQADLHFRSHALPKYMYMELHVYSTLAKEHVHVLYILYMCILSVYNAMHYTVPILCVYFKVFCCSEVPCGYSMLQERAVQSCTRFQTVRVHVHNIYQSGAELNIICSENLLSMVFYEWWRVYQLSHDLQSLERAVSTAAGPPTAVWGLKCGVYECSFISMQAVIHSEGVVKRAALKVWRLKTRYQLQQHSREVSLYVTVY